MVKPGPGNRPTKSKDMYLSWHITIRGKRVAARLAKRFNEQGLQTKVDEILEHVGNEMPRYCGRFMVRVINPGVESSAFASRCDSIYRNINQ